MTVELSESRRRALAEHAARIDVDFKAARASRGNGGKGEIRPAPPSQLCPCCGSVRWRPDGKDLCVGCEIAGVGR